MRRTLFMFTIAGALTLPLGTTALAANSATTTGATTQTSSRHHEALARIRHALEKLDLTADQKSKIESILSTARTSLKALHSSVTTTTDKTTKREEARAIIKKAIEDIRNVLTPAQREKLRDMREANGSGKKI